MARRKLAFGVGVNDVDYTVDQRVDGVRVICPFYVVWINMLQRAYYQPYKDKHPSYEGVSVCPEWLSLKGFRAWMETQPWQDAALDKDLLVQGNKVYAPEFCIFVPTSVNSFLIDRANDRGDYPCGVTLKKSGRFQAHGSEGGKRVGLGTYDTPEEAHEAYKRHKAGRAKLLAERQTDPRISDALLKRYC